MHMEQSEIWEYAATWGSFMRAGDPGACLYGFDETGRVQSEDHRADVIAEMVKNRAYVVANPDQYDADELTQIDAFIEAIKVAPCIVTPHLTCKDLIHEFRLTNDGDSWGTAMAWLWAVSAELTERGGDVAWNYSTGAGGNVREFDRYEAMVCLEATTEALERFGKMLDRLTTLLDKAGMSY